MNDFGIDITGLTGLVKLPLSWKTKVPEKERMFLIEGGPGCDPNPARGRKVTGKWVADKYPDARNSFDFEYVIKDGKKIYKKDTYENEPIASAPPADNAVPSEDTPKARAKSIPSEPPKPAEAKRGDKPVRTVTRKG